MPTSILIDATVLIKQHIIHRQASSNSAAPKLTQWSEHIKQLETIMTIY